jgi:DNA polymerase-3 subunit delta'
LVAKWIAASFFCRKWGCGVCSTCKRVLKELHADFHSVKAEEGRRDILIGQIRDLCRKIATKPFEADRRAAIIDNADRMNEEAQNAFLKSLEEPPPNSLIILVSSLPGYLAPTIRSRCQRFRFGRLSQEEMERFTTLHPELEKDFSTRLADGSPGRLTQLIKVDAGRVIKIYLDFIASSVLPSPVAASACLMKWAAEKSGLKQEIREKLRLSLSLAAGLLRDMAMIMEDVEASQLLNVDLEKSLSEATRLYEMQGIFYVLRQIQEAAADINGYVDPGLSIENVFRVIRDVRK